MKLIVASCLLAAGLALSLGLASGDGPRPASSMISLASSTSPRPTNPGRNAFVSRTAPHQLAARRRPLATLQFVRSWRAGSDTDEPDPDEQELDALLEDQGRLEARLVSLEDDLTVVTTTEQQLDPDELEAALESIEEEIDGLESELLTLERRLTAIG